MCSTDDERQILIIHPRAGGPTTFMLMSMIAAENDGKNMLWLQPWEPVGPLETEEDLAFSQAWEKELGMEVGPGHILHGLKATLIARRYDCDDALYQFEDGRVAKVHLTWRQSREISSDWPRTAIYASLEEWSNTDLRSDHAEWNDDARSLPDE